MIVESRPIVVFGPGWKRMKVSSATSTGPGVGTSKREAVKDAVHLRFCKRLECRAMFSVCKSCDRGLPLRMRREAYAGILLSLVVC